MRQKNKNERIKVSISTDISCLKWPNHIVDELIISSWITSCHLRMYQSIYDYIMLSMNCSRLMSSTCTSWQLTTHHDISQHIMSYHDTSCIMSSTNTTYGRMGHEIWSTHLIHPLYRLVYDVSPMEPDGLSHGHWTQSGLWCFTHGTGWFITRTLDTDARRWLLTKNIISLLYNDKLTSSGCSTDRPIRQTSYFGPSG